MLADAVVDVPAPCGSRHRRCQDHWSWCCSTRSDPPTRPASPAAPCSPPPAPFCDAERVAIAGLLLRPAPAYGPADARGQARRAPHRPAPAVNSFCRLIGHQLRARSSHSPPGQRPRALPTSSQFRLDLSAGTCRTARMRPAIGLTRASAISSSVRQRPVRLRRPLRRLDPIPIRVLHATIAGRFDLIAAALPSASLDYRRYRARRTRTHPTRLRQSAPSDPC